jgi:hypothetical protein
METRQTKLPKDKMCLEEYMHACTMVAAATDALRKAVSDVVKASQAPTFAVR